MNTVRVRIKDIVEPAPHADARLPVGAILDMFHAAPECGHVIVTEHDHVVGILSRIACMELGATSAAEVLATLEAGELADRSLLHLDGEMLAAKVAFEQKRDGYRRLQAGALVFRNGDLAGIATVAGVLKAVATENAARAHQMKRVVVSAAHDATPVSEPGIALAGKAELPDLLATLAHEVRTPLTGMIGLSELLAARVADAEHREIAAAIVRSGEALDRIVRDTLDYVSLERGNLQAHPETVSLADLTNDLRRLWQPQSVRRGLAFKVALQAETAGQIEVDIGRVRQIANNLISNALKFTAKGEVGVTIATQLVGSQPMLCITVTDTGTGIAARDRLRLFEAFETGQKSTGQPGWGLGLAISRALSTHLGGQLSLADNPGGGSVFSLLVPVKRVGATAPKPALVPRSGRFSPGQVLVVEDHEACAMVVIEALETAGWKVHCVVSLAEARQRLAVETYQAVLADLHVADGSSLTLIEAVRGGVNGDIPILAMTADMSANARAACLAAGADRVVEKPILGPALVAMLADALMARAAGGPSALKLRGRLAG